ncbi:hybrid sensor histidine kinase/response regulator [Carboxylicivirga caseinilyticus]|uniref:hybrid sensor histidine kinase/response regulator n=1 Tax=Carboxylicivirga caseinilyticus TaxID=3417572 RepID=UPI003D3589DB|nr:hybrid sensor histidine kinase/response regulator [Marinilabiliaceae bacterium A049]
MTSRQETNGRILIVDDNLLNIQILGNLLEAEGYSTEFAFNGLDALNWIDHDDFDLLLLDVMMPGMDGFEVCSRIRDNTKFDNLPIIFLTAKTDNESTAKGFVLKAQDYVYKPFEVNELLARIATHIELKKRRDQLINMNLMLEERVEQRTMELIKTQKQLENANKELLQLDDAKNKFLSIIGHEIRTPLNGIVGSMEILKTLVHDKDLIQSVTILETSVERLQKFSFDALLISSIKTGRLRTKFESIDIVHVLNNMCEKMGNKFPLKHIIWEVNKTIDKKEVTTDLSLINEVLERIIENAIVYSGDEPIINIDLKLNENVLRLKISDHGEGFSSEMLNHDISLLNPSKKHVDQNIGLDLYLSKLIMNFLNGKLEYGNTEDGAFVLLEFKMSTD